MIGTSATYFSGLATTIAGGAGHDTIKMLNGASALVLGGAGNDSILCALSALYAPSGGAGTPSPDKDSSLTDIVQRSMVEPVLTLSTSVHTPQVLWLTMRFQPQSSVTLFTAPAIRSSWMPPMLLATALTGLVLLRFISRTTLLPQT